MFLANRKPRQSREEAIRESMNSPIKLDPTITFSIPRANVQFDPEKHKYKCSCCGKGFNNLKQKSLVVHYFRQTMDIYLGVRNVLTNI
jgi:hypothetical protein